MTPGEFKAWFDGFAAACGNNPNEAQWAILTAKVSEIESAPIRVFEGVRSGEIPLTTTDLPAYRPRVGPSDDIKKLFSAN